MKHVFSIDVEDWYQGIEVPAERWRGFEKRIHVGVDRLLEMLARHGHTATCFVLGKVAEDHPDVVRAIHDAGHEVATHGFSHAKVYDLTPGAFRDEIVRSVRLLQDLTGQAVLGFRAPYFTITGASLWALDILAEEGIRYDSSIHPVHNYRYGIPGAARLPATLRAPGGATLLEVPVSTFPVGRVNVPVGGGAYLRIYPYWMLRGFLKALEARGEVLSLYIHPWELDAEHPRVPLPRRVAATHYFNLGSTVPKLEALFRDFSFASYRSVFQDRLEAVAA